jgi:hypothetical protein
MKSRISLAALLLLLSLFLSTKAEDAAGYDDANQQNDDNTDDDGMEDYGNNVQKYQQGNDYIKYWTEYAIVAKRCIV